MIKILFAIIALNFSVMASEELVLEGQSGYLPKGEVEFELIDESCGLVLVDGKHFGAFLGDQQYYFTDVKTITPQQNPNLKSPVYIGSFEIEANDDSRPVKTVKIMVRTYGNTLDPIRNINAFRIDLFDKNNKSLAAALCVNESKN